MLDVVGRLEKRVKYIWRMLFIATLMFYYKIENDSLSSIAMLFGLIFCCFIVEHCLAAVVRWIYKIDPESVIDVLKGMGVRGFYDKMNAFTYSEDYRRSFSFFPSLSNDYKIFKNYYDYNDYQFGYLSIYDNKNKNNDKIIVYKNIERTAIEDTETLKQLNICLNLELSYINNAFQIKNYYPDGSVESLHIEKAFSHFNKFIDNLRFMFNDDDFYTLMKESYFELKFTTSVQRNLIKKTVSNGLMSYTLNVKWSDKLHDMKTLISKKIFINDEVFLFGDYSKTLDYIKNKDNTEFEVSENHLYSRMFNYMLHNYKQKDKEIDYNNQDDLEEWKKYIIKKSLKMKKRKLKNKMRANHSPYIVVIKQSATNAVINNEYQKNNDFE